MRNGSENNVEIWGRALSLFFEANEWSEYKLCYILFGLCMVLEVFVLNFVYFL